MNMEFERRFRGSLDEIAIEIDRHDIGDRERAALQREIDQLRDDGSAETATRIEQLYDRKVDLKRRIEALSAE